MAIIPTVRCENMRTSLAFYTGMLDFEHLDGDDNLDDPCFSILTREGDQLWLSSHRGDGQFGQAIVVTTESVDALFRKFRGEGCAPRGIRMLPRQSMKGRSIRAGGRGSSTSTIPTATRCGSPKRSLVRDTPCNLVRELRKGRSGAPDIGYVVLGSQAGLE